MNQVRRPRIRVIAASPADRDWQMAGRPHFLNRKAFDRHTGRGWRGLRRLVPMRAYSVSPFVDLVVGLTFLLLPIWGLWWVTQKLCPPAASLCLWTLRQIRMPVRSIHRWAYRSLWRLPAQRLGVAITGWLWLLGAWLVAVTVSLATGYLWGVVKSLPLLALIVAFWHLLRWWRRRVYRPRPLPARRPRFPDD